LLRLAKVSRISGGPSAIAADVFRIAHQFFVLLHIRFDKPDILKIAQVFLMTRMWHFFLSHFIFPRFEILEIIAGPRFSIAPPDLQELSRSVIISCRASNDL